MTMTEETFATAAAVSVASETSIPERDLLEVTWHSFDLKSGRRGQQLRVAGDPTISRIISEPTETSLGVYCWDEEAQAEVPGWDAATLAGRTLVVALDADERPLWGGLVLRRRSDHGPVVTLDTATPEAYFDRRYVKDHFWYMTDTQVMLEGLIGDATDGGPETIRVDLPEISVAVVRDREYADDDDKTVLTSLQEFTGLADGQEFTVDLEWQDEDHTVLDLVVRIRTRLGRASTTPLAVFEMPGPVVSFSYIEDYTAEHGANDVMAFAAGEGEARPESEHKVADDLIAAGWVKYEHRWPPNLAVQTFDALEEHAASRLEEMKDGLTELTLVAHLDTAPRVGQEFHLGDDVEASLTCPRFPPRRDADGALIPGYTEVMRCVAWSIDFAGRRLTPTLRRATDG